MAIYSDKMIMPTDKFPTKFEQNVYIKEEVIISDMSDYSENESKYKDDRLKIKKDKKKLINTIDECKKENIIHITNHNSEHKLNKKFKKFKKIRKKNKIYQSSDFTDLKKDNLSEIKNVHSNLIKFPIVILERLPISIQKSFEKQISTDNKVTHVYKDHLNLVKNEDNTDFEDKSQDANLCIFSDNNKTKVNCHESIIKKYSFQEEIQSSDEPMKNNNNIVNKVEIDESITIGTNFNVSDGFQSNNESSDECSIYKITAKEEKNCSSDCEQINEINNKNINEEHIFSSFNEVDLKKDIKNIQENTFFQTNEICEISENTINNTDIPSTITKMENTSFNLNKACEQLVANMNESLKLNGDSEQHAICLEDFIPLLNIPDGSDDEITSKITNNWDVHENQNASNLHSESEIENIFSQNTSIFEEKEITDFTGLKMELFIEICVQCKAVQKRCSGKILYKCSYCQTDLHYQCQMCKSEYKYLSGIYTHIDTKHLKTSYSMQPAECSRCGTMFKALRNVKDHLRFCMVMPYLKCKFCPKVVKYKNVLRKHIQSQHKKLINKFELENILREIVANSEDLKEIVRKNAEKKYGNFIPYKSKNLSLEKYSNLYCKNCNETFKNRSDINQLKCSSCFAKLLIQCKKCEKRYKTRTGIIHHLKNECPPSCTLLYKCNDCNYETFTKTSIRKHMRWMHMSVDPAKYVQCLDCNKKFKLLEMLRQHEFACHNNTHIRCKFCKQRIDNDADLKFHMKKHSASDVKNNDLLEIVKGVTSVAFKYDLNSKFNILNSIRAYCSTCDKYIALLEKVTKCQFCNTPFLYCCKLCDQEKTQYVRMRIHVIRKHGLKIFKCENNCGQSFSYKCDYLRHQRICGKEPHLHCGNCGFKTKYKQTLSLHMDRGYCLKKYNYSSNQIVNVAAKKNVKISKNFVKYHTLNKQNLHNRDFVKNCRTKIKSKISKTSNNLYCNECGKTFKNNIKMSLHAYSCMKNKVFLCCDHCNFRTLSKYDLVNHIHSKHAARLFRGIDAFHCEKCTMDFKTYFGYTRHVESRHPRNMKN